MIDWNRSVSYAMRNLAAYPDAYYIVRFEDLVEKPEETIRALFTFLQLDCTPEFLEPGSFGQNSSFSDVPSQGISQSPIGRHVTHLSAVDVAVCNTLGRRLMPRYGYALNTVKIPLSARIRAWARIVVELPIEHLRRIKRAMWIKAGLLDPASEWLNNAQRLYSREVSR